MEWREVVILRCGQLRWWLVGGWLGVGDTFFGWTKVVGMEVGGWQFGNSFASLY